MHLTRWLPGRVSEEGAGLFSWKEMGLAQELCRCGVGVVGVCCLWWERGAGFVVPWLCPGPKCLERWGREAVVRGGIQVGLGLGMVSYGGSTM